MSKYFTPYDNRKPRYPEDAKLIRETITSEHGTLTCSDYKLEQLWEDFSGTYEAGHLNPDDFWIEKFINWLELQED